ncbi:MAG: hypothetical protein Q8873_04115, partial [Bacillota bacterium]|nr:hypothetical protein [Bacillota bacterium]
MNRYSNLLYKRGFLFTDIQDLSFIDEESDNIIKKWSKVNLGLYSLYYDPDLIFGLYRKEDNWIVIAGMVLNPFDGCNDSNEIAQKLYEYKSGSNIKFLNYLNQLSGRFVLISIQGAKVEIFNDACATRTVFYDRYSSKVLVSSHATLIAAIMGYEISSEALYFFYNKDYKEALIKRLPGLMSPYEEVLILSPNTKLTIPDMKIVRFFPYKVNPSYGSYDDLEEEVSDLMASQIKLLNAKTKIAMSLTAGMDSRLSLAASKDICADIDYFTFLTKNVSHIEDAKIAQQICKENDLKHNLYHWDSNKNSEGLKEFEYIWERNLGIRRGILWLNKLYIDSFPKDR